MTPEIRVYVEGGGDSADGKAKMRGGFGEFLREIVALARQRHIRWSVIACGGRDGAFDSFRFAQEDYPDAFSVLLVDSEGPLRGPSARQHLIARDGWDLSGIGDGDIHVMVQAVEAWFIADREALRKYYGAGFSENSLPNREDPEGIPKDDLEPALKLASRRTKKGPYRKLDHGSELLGKVRPLLVRQRCAHCRDVFNALCDAIGAEHLE